MAELKTKAQVTAEDHILAAHILLTLDMEQNFKLYSYKIITQEQFQERNNDLMHRFNNAMKAFQPEKTD